MTEYAKNVIAKQQKAQQLNNRTYLDFDRSFTTDEVKQICDGLKELKIGRFTLSSAESSRNSFGICR